jgi:hypothetical protein
MTKKRKTAPLQGIGNFEDKLLDFIKGVIFFFILELSFMLGGLYTEKSVLGISATGIPSLLGLIVWFLASLIYSKKKYLFLGGLTTSILVPIILIIVTLTGFVSFSSLMYSSIATFIVLELILLWVLLKK